MLSSENAAVVTESSVASSVVAAAAVTIAAASDVETLVIESISNLQLQELNLDQGDPLMYEAFWKKFDEELKITFLGSQSLSYFAKHTPDRHCFFLEAKLEQEIKNLHNLVGNAVVEDRYIVVGNGSSQLVQAALYALSEPLNSPDPIDVVSATPFYSCYPQLTDQVRSRMFKWGGDAHGYDKEGAYIELVTSPNNPDGEIRGPVVNRDHGMLIHDLAYYWPQYTPITAPADHDIMLFTVSKCTGHAGSRIGWAIVKDEEVAKKMVNFVEVGTIGVSKEAQMRAATVLEMISSSCKGGVESNGSSVNFFEYIHLVMAEKWRKLREALNNTELLHVPNFPLEYCNFRKDFFQANPGYAFMKCEAGMDLEMILKEEKVRSRGGKGFGCGPEHARISMLAREEDIHQFITIRLPSVLQRLALNRN